MQMSEKKISERELFQQSVKNVTPLKNSNRADLRIPAKKPFFVSHVEKHSQNYPLPSHWFESRDLAPVAAEESISYCDPSISPLIFKRFINKWGIEDTLDLHGFNIDTARKELHYFLTFAIEQQLAKVLIIHGKGYSTLHPYPKLKNQLNIWLRTHPNILAFHSAKKQHGGSGAVVIMLKS